MPKNLGAEALPVLDQTFQGGFRNAINGAWMRYRRESDGRITWRALNSPTLISALKLQTADGRFRADARARLDGDLPGNLGAGDELHQSIRRSGVETSPWAEWQLELLTSDDPIAVLDRVRASISGDVIFYRLKTTPALWWRLALWQAITELAKGAPPQAIVEAVRGRRNPAVSGMVELAPASVVCGPLLARQQPLAAVFMTAQGAQVLALSGANAFERPTRIASWPIGMYRIIFSGPGHKTHATDVGGFDSGHAERILTAAVSGANRLLHYLTAPQLWIDAQSGALDLDGRWMTWASVLFGLDAIASLGAIWTGADALWSAFRALGVLQGLWNGNEIDRVLLDQLLDPRLLKAHAVSALPAGQERDWAAGIVSNYERDIKAAFPGQSLDQALKTIVQVRNLVHGVRGRKGSTVRLDALRQIERSTPNLQLINEMAVFWWTAVLLSPSSHCRVGVAPWEM